MRRLALILDLLVPFSPFLLTLGGGLGVIYIYGTGKGGRFLLAVSLLILLAGVSLFVMEETRRDEFLARFLGEKSKRPKKRRRRMGKRCPQCKKMIYHRRTTCQHCGYEFPSKKYKEEKAKKKSEEKEEEAQA